MVNTDSMKGYFERARRFDQDRLVQVERSARIAWFIAVAASLLAAEAPLRSSPLPASRL